MMCSICELAPAGNHNHVGYLVIVRSEIRRPDILWFPHEATHQDAANRWLSMQQARSYGADLRVFHLGDPVEFKAVVNVTMDQVKR